MNKFYTQCNSGHKYHISWPYCPDCKDDVKGYHQSAINQLQEQIERHEAAIERLEVEG